MGRNRPTLPYSVRAIFPFKKILILLTDSFHCSGTYRAGGDHTRVSIRWYRESFTSQIQIGNPIGIVLNPSFNPITFQNDFALLHFEANFFPTLNVIRFHFAPVVGPLTVYLAGFGLIHPDATGGVSIPNVGPLEVGACPAPENGITTTETHMCASSPTIALCAGDNGAGIFAEIGGRRVLVSFFLLAPHKVFY